VLFQPLGRNERSIFRSGSPVDYRAFSCGFEASAFIYNLPWRADCYGHSLSVLGIPLS